VDKNTRFISLCSAWPLHFGSDTLFRVNRDAQIIHCYGSNFTKTGTCQQTLFYSKNQTKYWCQDTNMGKFSLSTFEMYLVLKKLWITLTLY